MAFNGSGVFLRLRNWVADAAAGIKIRADFHDAEDDGFAAGLTNCITRDGQSTVLQNIPWNSKRITGLQDPVNPQDAATMAWVGTRFTAGGKFTGDLEIEKDCPAFVFDDTDDCGARIEGQHKGKTRWIMRFPNADPETGTGNTGSNFDIESYADDGTSKLRTSLNINRATGAYTVNGDLITARSATEGVVYLGSDKTHYVYWSGSTYAMPGGRLTLGGYGVGGLDAVTVDQLNTKQNALGFTPVQQSGGAYQQGNKVYIGWDGSGLRAQVDGLDMGQFVFGSSGVVRNGRLAHAGDVAIVSSPGGMYEPWNGAIMSGYEWTNVGYPILTYLRFRYMQLYTTGWFTCGYA